MKPLTPIQNAIIILLGAILASTPILHGQANIAGGGKGGFDDFNYSGTPQFYSNSTINLNDSLGLTGTGNFVYASTNWCQNNTGGYLWQDIYVAGPGAQSGNAEPWNQLPYAQLSTPDGTNFYLTIWDSNGDVWANGYDYCYTSLTLDPTTQLWSMGQDAEGNPSTLADITNPGAVDSLAPGTGAATGTSGPVPLAIPNGFDPGYVANQLLQLVNQHIGTILTISTLYVLITLFQKKVLGNQKNISLTDGLTGKQLKSKHQLIGKTVDKLRNGDPDEASELLSRFTKDEQAEIIERADENTENKGLTEEQIHAIYDQPDAWD